MLVEAGTECLIRHFYRHGDSFIAISWSKRPINLEPVALGIMSYDQWRRSHDRQNMRTNVSGNFYVNSNIWIYPVIGPWVLNILRHCALQWRYIERDGVSNHQPRYYLLNCLFRCRSRKTSKLRVTGLCAWNSPSTGGYPHKRPIMRKMVPFDDVIIVRFLHTETTHLRITGPFRMRPNGDSYAELVTS